jgi:hypothetical protein
MGLIIWFIWIRPIVPVLEPLFAQMPPNYYNAARNYVAANYNPTGEKNIVNLVAFLNQIQLRDYAKDVFDCSESSAMLEWLLEGAGFNASIASNPSYTNGHTWVLVTLIDGETVAIESTSLTANYYASPGIIEAPDGRFGEYAHEHLQSPGIPTRETYYNPPKKYTSLEDALKDPIISNSELDWWNASPYNSLEPFSEWD